MKKDYMNLLSITTAVFVVVVALSAFTLSFNALESLAGENGFARPLSYLFPIIIDLALISFSFNALRATLAGERALFSWSMIVLFTVLSMILNGLHANENNLIAGEMNLIAIAIHAIVPLVLFLTFETFMTQIKSIVKSNIGRLQSVIDEMKLNNNELKTAVCERDETIDALNARIDKLQERSNELTQAKRTITKYENQLKAMQSEMIVPESVGDVGRDFLRVIDEQMTQKEFCDLHNENASWVSRAVSKMNGGVSDE